MPDVPPRSCLVRVRRLWLKAGATRAATRRPRQGRRRTAEAAVYRSLSRRRREGIGRPPPPPSPPPERRQPSRDRPREGRENVPRRTTTRPRPGCTLALFRLLRSLVCKHTSQPGRQAAAQGKPIGTLWPLGALSIADETPPRATIIVPCRIDRVTL